MAKEKVIVGISGGVDSAVAAATLIAAGFEVVAVFLCIAKLDCAANDMSSRSCCSPADAADAREVAMRLGVEFVNYGAAHLFEPVLEYFVREYGCGRTPNPCCVCNRDVKLFALQKIAQEFGATRIATGHWANVLQHNGKSAIARALCVEKDQSYALWALPQDAINMLMLPLGAFASKADVRQMARQLGLEVHNKPDSQEICFSGGDAYQDIVRLRFPNAFARGEIVHVDGKKMGYHDGYGNFTVGQRKGLRVSHKKPLYVINIDASANKIYVGEKEYVMRSSLEAHDCVWHFDAPHEFEADVQIRYMHRGAKAKVTRTDDGFFAEFFEPVAAITPGQCAVIYSSNVLLGGGWIS